MLAEIRRFAALLGQQEQTAHEVAAALGTVDDDALGTLYVTPNNQQFNTLMVSYDNTMSAYPHTISAQLNEELPLESWTAEFGEGPIASTRKGRNAPQSMFIELRDVGWSHSVRIAARLTDDEEGVIGVSLTLGASR